MQVQIAERGADRLGPYRLVEQRAHLRATADAQWENREGLGLYGAVHGNQTDAGDAGNSFDWGVLAQVGYLLNKKTEAFARYDVLKLDDVGPGDEDTFNEFTVGANYYFGPDGAYRHNAPS